MRQPDAYLAVSCVLCLLSFLLWASPAKLSLSKATRGARAKSGSHQTCANDTWDLEPKCRQIVVLRYLKARLPPNYRRTTLLGRNTFATTAHKTSEETARRKTRPLLLHVGKNYTTASVAITRSPYLCVCDARRTKPPARPTELQL